MRSKTAQRILEETPQEIKDKVRKETDKRMENKQLYERLDYLQGAMEKNCDNPQFLKHLKREYKDITKQLFPKTLVGT